MRMRSLTRGDVARLSLALIALLVPSMASAVDLGPQGVVRQFCQADGNGQRATIPGWAGLAALLTWAYEPAWDTVALINGYTVGSPRSGSSENLIAVDVRYTVVGQLSPLGLNPEPHMESVTYEVQPDEQGNWHILGPLPPPHLFVSRVDIDAMRRSLSNGGVDFIANSVFVWQMFQSAGWDVPFEPTTDLLSGATYRVVDSAKPGDLVVYLRDGAPYHVGLLEAKNQVISSTLNAGITRTPIDAFPGEVQYLRLGRTETVPTATTDDSAPADTPVVRPTPIIPATPPAASVAVAKKKGKPTPSPKRRHPAQPSTHKPVKSKHKNPRKQHPTPAAQPK